MADVAVAQDNSAPTEPSDVVSTAASPNRIDVSWNPSGDDTAVTGYEVSVSVNQGQSWEYVGTTSGTSYFHTGRNPSTEYWYRVRALDAANNTSGWAPGTQGAIATTPATDTQAPTVPTGLEAKAISPTEVQLFWNPSTDNIAVTGYYVYVNDGWQNPFAKTTDTSFRHSGLDPDTVYRYRVSAYDAAPNDSPWTADPDLASVTTPASDNEAPTVPTGLTATAVSSTQINLSWNSSTDNVNVTEYVVYVNDEWQTPVAHTADTSFQHINLDPATEYQYRVSAFDGSLNHSAWTPDPPVSATTNPATSNQPAAQFSGMQDEFPNPGRGFSKLATNLTDITAQNLIDHRNAGYRLVTHRQLLQDYANIDTLPESFISTLNRAANLHREHGTMMIMQFSYDNDPADGVDRPPLDRIAGHISQLEPFFKGNADIIAALHAGFLGVYGEWASWTGDPSNPMKPTAQERLTVRDELYDAVDRDTPIAFRTLADLESWYPTPLSSKAAFYSLNDQARAGVHNDCFLSNDDDSGTYWTDDGGIYGRTPSTNRFRQYHQDVSEWTTTGGENCSDGEYKACEYVLADGAFYNWRYRRDDWGTVFDDSWKAEGCYKEIKRKLGYRFEIDSIDHASTATFGERVDVSIALRNVGWARTFRKRPVKVSLIHQGNGETIFGDAADVRRIPTDSSTATSIVVSLDIPSSASSGTYDVFVGLPSKNGNRDFAIRFANAADEASGQSWESASYHFKTGTTVTIQ